MSRPIPYGRQNITEADIQAVAEVLRADCLTQGPKLPGFENAFATYVGTKYAVAVSNGTAALHLCTLALEMAPGDKVITTPITFAASANCVRYCGADVVFADIDPATYLLDIHKVRALLEAAPAGTYKGIVPVDFAGRAVNLEAFRALADEFGCLIIEDACHAPGGHFTDSKGQQQVFGNGRFADLAIFSFHPVKHIACGEGGNGEDFQVNGTIWEGKILHSLYRQAYTPWEWHPRLMEVAAAEGLVSFSSPFGPTAVDFLEELNVPAYKIASFEITDIPLIRYVASKGKPVIISTGIATHEDIELALEACRSEGNHDIALLKCTSSYPVPIAEANMVMVRDMAERYGVVTGLSDHTMGSTVPVVGTCFGARIIEKHFILDRSIGGPDASYSMNEQEFTDKVKAVRETESAIGRVDYALTDKQRKGRDFSRSLYMEEDIAARNPFTVQNVRSIRPGFGLHPWYLPEVLGRTATCDLKWGKVEWGHDNGLGLSLMRFHGYLPVYTQSGCVTWTPLVTQWFSPSTVSVNSTV